MQLEKAIEGKSSEYIQDIAAVSAFYTLNSHCKDMKAWEIMDWLFDLMFAAGLEPHQMLCTRLRLQTITPFSTKEQFNDLLCDVFAFTEDNNVFAD